MDNFIDESRRYGIRRLPKRPVWWRRCISVIRQLLTVIMFAVLIAGVLCLVCFWPVIVGLFLDHFVAFGRTGG